MSQAEFHLLQEERAALWPRTMTTLTTHDTKRSEDTRARMLEIAELPDEFARLVRDVFALTPPPDEATGYFLIQNILGAWPRDGHATPAFTQRLRAYAVKAAREADRLTSWYDNDEAFEAELTGWVARLTDGPATALLADFALDIDRGGVAVSLGRKLLQLVGPGVPDTYQGTEFLDFSLVDPDNRRFVNYQALRAGEGAPEDVDKQRIVRAAMHLRRERPQLFLEGGYRAIFAAGPAREHAVGMVRTLDDAPQVIAVATRTPLALERAGGWRGTTLTLPEGTWTDRLTGREYSGTVEMAQLCAELPTVLLTM